MKGYGVPLVPWCPADQRHHVCAQEAGKARPYDLTYEQVYNILFVVLSLKGITHSINTDIPNYIIKLQRPNHISLNHWNANHWNPESITQYLQAMFLHLPEHCLGPVEGTTLIWKSGKAFLQGLAATGLPRSLLQNPSKVMVAGSFLSMHCRTYN